MSQRTFKPARRQRFALRPISLAACLLGAAPASFGLPQGAVANGGQASVSLLTPTQMQINQTTPRAGLDWTSFSIAAGESVNITQPSARAVLINRVTGNDTSQIHGALSSNGQVWLVNPRGVYFGPQSQVNVGGLLATTLAIGPHDIAGGRLQLGGPQAGAGELRAQGTITASDGSVLLVSPRLLQSGRVQARRVGFAAASEVLVDVEGDGLVFFNARNDRLDARLSVLGTVLADGGTAELRAAARAGFADTVLNLEGVVRARSLGQRNGRIVVDGGSDGITRIAGTLDAAGPASGQTGGDVLVLGQKVMLDTAATIDASAAAGGGRVRVGGGFQGTDASLRNSEMVVARAGSRIDASALAAGDGGQVVLWADRLTRFHGTLVSRGAAGGRGGAAEVSGREVLDFQGDVDLAGPAGGGSLLLDPDIINVDGSAGAISGNVDFNVPPSGTTTIGAANLSTRLGSFAVTLQAKNTINVSSAVTGTQPLMLQAGGDINVSASISTAGLTLSADDAAGGTASGSGRVATTGGATLSAGSGTLLITNNTTGGTHALDGDLSGNAISIVGPATLTASAGWAVGAGNGLVTGVIGESGGSRSLTKLGSGVLELRGNNSYSGGSTVSAGTLRISGAAASAGSGTIALGANTLDIAGGASIANTLTVADGATIGNSSGAGTLAPTSPAAALSVPAVATLNLSSVGTSLTVSRDIGGSGGVTKAGAGTVILSGSNSFGGPLQIDAGTLRLQGGSAVADGVAVTLANVAGAALELAADEVLGSLAGGGGTGGDVAIGALTLTVGGNNADTGYGGVISGVGGQLVKQGSGVLTLTAASTYSGGSTVGGGTLAVSGSGVAGSGPIAVGANRLDIGGGATVSNALTTGDGATIGNTSGSGTLSNSGTLALGDGFNLNLASSGTGLAVNRLIADSNDNATVTVSGSAPVTLGNAGNSYGGDTRVQGAGVLAVAAAGALGDGGLTLDNGTLRATSGITFAGGVTLSAGGGTFDVPVANQTLTLSGNVTGAGNLTKTSAGTLLLSGNNGYGETRLNGGVLSVAAANDVGSGGLTFAGGTLLATGTLTLARDVTINAGGGTFDIDNGETLTLQNVIGGAGSLTKSGGSGRLVLEAASSYAGTTVSAGTLTLRNAGSVGSGTVLLDGATSTLRNERGSTLVIAGTISGTGRLQQAGSGVVQLEGNNSYSGGSTVSAGTLRISGAAASAGSGTIALDNNTLDIASGATVGNALTVSDGATISNSSGAAGTLGTAGGALALGNGDNLNLTAGGGGLVVDRQITDGGGNNSTLTITGSAPVTLGNGLNSYGGQTRVGTAGAPDTAGTLKLTHADAASGSAIVLRSGVSVLDIATGVTLAKPVTVAASNATIQGGGTLDNSATLALGNGFNLNLAGSAGGLTIDRQLTDGSNNDATLTITGSAPVTLGHTGNSHGGGTSVRGGGSLAVAAAGNLGDAGVLLLDNGSLLASETFSFARGVTLDSGGGSFDVASGKTLTLSAAVGGTGSLTKLGAGTLALGAANAYGATAINAGVLSVAAAGNLGLGALSFGGGTLAASETLTLSGLTFSAGGASFDVAAGKTLTLQNSSGAGGVTKAGGGTLLLAGTTSYGGNTNVNAGTLGVSGVFSAAGSIALGANTLDIAGGATIANSLTVADGATISNSSGAGTLSATGGPLTLGAGVNNLNLASTGSGLLIAREIADTSNASTLTITGSAPVTLSNGANSYGGNTLVGTAGAPDTAGTLKLTDAGAASGAAIVLRTAVSVLDISNGITLAKPVTVSASNATITNTQGSGTLDNSGTLALGAAVNLRLASTGSGLVISRQITDTGNDATLTVSGSAPVTLGHALNSHGGGSSVGGGGSVSVSAAGNLGDAGVVTLDNGSLLASAGFTLDRNITLGAGGGTFDVANAATLTLQNAVGGSGNLTKTGAGTMVLSGSNGYGATNINGGVLAVSAAANVGNGALAFNGGTLAATDTLALARNVTLNAGGGTFDVGSGKTLTLSNPVGGAAGNLAKTGAGTLVLAAAGSYAGTAINAGVLALAAADRLGSGAVSFAGGTLQASETFTLARDVTLAAGGGSIDVASGKTLTLANSVGGVGDLRKLGPGTLVLANTNSYAATQFNAGAVSVSAATNLGSGALVFDGGSLSASSSLTLARNVALDAGGGSFDTSGAGTTLTLANAVGGAGSLAKSGAGTLVLAAAGNYSGGTIVNAGTLRVGTSGAAGSGSIALGANTLDIAGGATVSNALTLANGATIANSQGSGTLGNTGTLALGAAVNVNLTSSGGGLTIDRQITDSNNDATLTVTGSAPVTLGHPLNSHGGGSSVRSGGSLAVAVAGNLGDGGVASFDSGRLLAGGSFTLASNVDIGAGGATFEVAGGATVTLVNPVAGSGSLAKTGAGTLVLAGANAYGATSVSGGVLAVAAAAGIGGGPISFNGGSLLASETFTLARAVTLDAGGGGFEVAGGKTLTLASAVGGAGGLNKQGAGTLVLAGNNSYAGTTVSAGVVSASAAGNLGQGAVVLASGTLRASESFTLARDVTVDASGGSFDVAGGKTLTLANSVGGAGDLTKLGAGTLVLANTNSYAATNFKAGAVSAAASTNLGSGALVFDGGSLSASNSFTLARNVTLDAGGGGFDTAAAGTALTLANPVGGVGSLAKSGAGTLVLAAANNYSGGTAVSGGTVRVSVSGAAGSGGIALNAHTLDIAGGSTVSNALSLANGATITNTAGSGTLDNTGTLALADGANLNLASSAGGLTVARTMTDGAGSARITVTGGSATLTADNSFDGGSTIGNGASLQLGGGLATGNAGSGAIANHGVLRIDRNNTLTMSAVISGSGQLEQAGSGRTVLTAANSYSGGSTVNNGTLAISGAGAAAGSGAIVLANTSAVLDIGNGASLANAVTSHGAIIANSAGSGELAGSLTLAATSRLSSTAGGLTITGTVADGSGGSGFGIEKIGTGSVTLASAANSYRGNTTVSAGTLRTSGDERIGNTSAVVVNAGELALGGSETIASLAGAGGMVSVPVALRVGAAGTDTGYAGVFSGSGAIEKIGAGSLSLSGNSSTHSGSLTVSDGTLALNVTNALGSGSSLVVAGGSVALAGNHQSVAGVSLRGGSITGSGARLTSASSFDLRNGSVSAELAGASGSVGLDKTTGGSVVLSGPATYAGATTVSAGTLSLAAADAVPAATRLIVNGGEFNIGALAVTIGELQLESGSVTGSGTLTAGQYAVSGGTSSVGLGAGVLDSIGITTLTGPVQASQINVNAGVLTLAQDNVLAGAGRTVTVAGNATLVNNGSNQAGQLNLAGTLSGTGSFSAGGYALAGGSVNSALGGGALTSTGSSAINASVGASSVVVTGGQLSIGSTGQLTNNTATVTVQTGATLQLAGDETVGSLALAGTLNTAAGVSSTLTALNYALAGGSVNTPLGGGALASTGSSALNAAAAAHSVNVASGVLALNQAQQLTAAPAVSVASGATLALAADQTIGTLSGAGAVTLAGFTLASGSGGDSSFQGALSGSGALLKQGTSTFTLAGDNQHARTRVAGGTLALSAAGHLADASEVQVDAGATLRAAADETVGRLALSGTLAAATGTTPTLTAANVVLAGATVDSALGAGNLTSTGGSVVNANVGAASVAVEGGTLTLNLAQQLTASPALSIAAGAVVALGADQTTGLLSGAGTVTVGQHTLATGSGGASTFHGTVSGSGTLLKQGPSTLTLAGDNQHGQTRVAAGTLVLAAAQRLADTSALRVDSGATLRLGGDETVASLLLAGTLAGSGMLQAANYRLDGGTVNTPLGSGALASSGSSVLNATVAAGSLAVDGGRLTLAAPQLLSPQAEVTVAAGAVLELNGIDTAAQLVLRGNLAGSGTLTAASYELDGGSTDANLGTGTLASRGNSTLRGSVAAGLVNVFDGNLALSTAQQLRQLPEVNIFGGARVTLAADQSFGKLAGGGRVQLGSFTLASGAGGDSSFAGVIDGDGGFIKRGASVFTLAGNNAWRGRTLVEQGTLRVGDNGSAGSLGSGDIEVHGTLAMARGDSVTLAQAISGSGNVEQHGGSGGRLLLSGSNKTYSGATRVLGGELATAGAENLPDTSTVSVAAGASLALGGRETLQSLAADGSVSLAGDLVSSGELALRGAVTVPGNQTVVLSGTRIDAVNPGNRWGAGLGFDARDRITLSSGIDGGGQRPLTLASFSAAAGGRIDAGSVAIAGNGNVSGGQLVIASDSAQTAAPASDILAGKLVQSRPVAYTADAIVQGASSRLEVAAAAEISLLTPNGASIQLGRLDNRFSGRVSAVAGSPTAAWTVNESGGASLQNRVRIGGDIVNVGGAGVIADVVEINADTLATRGDSAIVARLPFDRDVGTTVSLPALTLILTQRSFTLTFPYGNTGVEGLHVNVGSRAWGPRTTGSDAGYMTVLPRGGGASGNTAVLLVGPNVNAGGYGFFFDGASVQGEVPVYYNGVLPATPQVENSISATVAVSEAARKQRFDEAVRTENVALRLRAGVIAEVGPAPSATQGPEGARLPASCAPAAGALTCTAKP